MMMPDVICVWDRESDDGTRDRGFSTSFPAYHPNRYIRADISEELARALEAMGDESISDVEFNKIRNAALTRFRALNP